MRIIYVAKHHSGDNDDEGAIYHALTLLGHDVVRIQETDSNSLDTLDGDFILFHKWMNFRAMKEAHLPLVFWYFDLVSFPEPMVESRNKLRRDWMEAVIPLIQLGFCTDGDWVKQDTSGKLLRLTQGADIRTACLLNPTTSPEHIKKLFFAGTWRRGETGTSCLMDLKTRYGPNFYTIDGRYRIHGRKLAQEFANSEIVIAPDGPITDNYWSNRVYLTLGLGGFLLHPYAASLLDQYNPSTELAMYHSRENLYELIEYFWKNPERRLAFRVAGHQRTIAEHTYTHRCVTLIETVKERLF